MMRRKARTLLTVGVAAILALGMMADGLEAGYSSVLNGANADLVLSDPEAFDIILSSVDESVQAELAVMPEVAQVPPLLQGIVQAAELPYFFIFGYQAESFVLERFQIVAGSGLDSRDGRIKREDVTDLPAEELVAV